MTRLIYSRQAQSGLQHHPWIGRRVDEHLRELIISRGHTGYVALDACWILAIRHQREAGYTT